MSQDTYLGRMATTVQLFMKDKSLIDRAISVFHTVMKTNLYDSKPSQDILALTNLIISYALKSNMSIEALVRLFLSCGPIVMGDKISFMSFNYSYMCNLLKGLMRGQIPSVEIDASLYTDMITKLSNLYLRKLINLKKKWNFAHTRDNKKLIRNKLFGTWEPQK